MCLLRKETSSNRFDGHRKSHCHWGLWRLLFWCMEVSKRWHLKKTQITFLDVNSESVITKLCPHLLVILSYHFTENVIAVSSTCKKTPKKSCNWNNLAWRCVWVLKNTYKQSHQRKHLQGSLSMFKNKYHNLINCKMNSKDS